MKERRRNVVPGVYELTVAADRDLQEIFEFSVEAFGEAQAVRYLSSLDKCFRRLADLPGLGRSIEALRRGYYRFEHQKHAVFYTPRQSGVLIVRVLHNRMDWETRL